MSEPETPAEQVGGQNQHISEADTGDQYQDPEMGELEVRDITGFSENMLAPPTPRDIKHSAERIQRYYQARIESVVREALEGTFRTQTTTFQGLGAIGMRMGIDGIKLLRGGGMKTIFIVERYQGSTPMRTHIGMAMLGKMTEQLVEPV